MKTYLIHSIDVEDYEGRKKHISLERDIPMPLVGKMENRPIAFAEDEWLKKVSSWFPNNLWVKIKLNYSFL